MSNPDNLPAPVIPEQPAVLESSEVKFDDGGPPPHLV